MIARRLFIVLFALFLTTGILNAQKENSSAPFFFIQLTDPQFGFIESNNGFEKETALYEKAVKEINRLKPDFVVITGDFVNTQGDKLQIAEFKRITGMIDTKVPVYYTPGNHDIGQAPAQQDIDSYISQYGDTKFSFKYKNNSFIGFNSNFIKARTPDLEQAQFDWLKKELSESKGVKHIILFCHHPFFTVSPDEPDNYSNVAIETRNKYLALFKEYNVNAVFAGHTHANGFAKFGDMEMIITSAVGRPLGKDPSGFRIVKVYDSSIESNFYPLDQIPATITFDSK
jgi:serine/threonine-protein phosphatase CPPED1